MRTTLVRACLIGMGFLMFWGCDEAPVDPPPEPDEGFMILDKGPDRMEFEVPRPDMAEPDDGVPPDMAPDVPPPTQCADGMDNDDDGDIDFPDDPGCADSADDDESDDPLPACADGVDNDGDNAIDLADPGCVNGIDRDETDVGDPACANGLDDDGDGEADFPLDPGCGAAGDEDEADPLVPRACSNGEDDDGDGAIDYPNDPGCAGLGDPDETDPMPAPTCSNGLDDDGDGEIDYPADPGCASAADYIEESTCADGRAVIDLNGALVDGAYDGDLTDAPEGMVGSCGGAAGPERVFFYRVEQPLERLVFSTDHPETTVPTVLYVRRSCDVATDLACDRGATDHPGRAVTLTSVEPGLLAVVVDTGSRIIGPGAFRLTVEEIPALACRNGIDDDGDALIDLFDPGCLIGADDDETDPDEVPACADGEDNDGDNLTDYPDDPDCESAGALREGPLCEAEVPVAEIGSGGGVARLMFNAEGVLDGSCRAASNTESVIALTLDEPADVTVQIENEGGVPLVLYIRSDCDDTESEVDCQSNPLSQTVYEELEPGTWFIVVDSTGDPPMTPVVVTVRVRSLITQCNDEIDNDEDGLLDLTDPGCEGLRDTSERDPVGVPECFDGDDNDGDGLTDFPDDPECGAAGDTTEAPECLLTDDLLRVGTEGGVLNFDTTGNGDLYDSCGRGPEQVILLRLDRPAGVIAEITAAGFDTVLSIRRICDDENSELDCDDDGGVGLLSRVAFEQLEAGTYFLMAGGLGNRTGPMTVVITTDPVPLVICSDEIDNDGDGLIDAEDPGCAHYYDGDEADPAEAAVCSNGADDDGDGLTDYPADPGCATAGWPTEVEHCNSGVPLVEIGPEGGEAMLQTHEQGAEFTGSCGEGAGLENVLAIEVAQPSNVQISVFEGDNLAENAVVYLRADCDRTLSELSCGTGGIAVGARIPVGTIYAIIEGDEAQRAWRAVVQITPVEGACLDGVDNDEDGLIDVMDPGCLNTADEDETDPEVLPACADGQDNDEDGDIDYPADVNCTSAGAPTEASSCAGGIAIPVIESGRFVVTPDPRGAPVLEPSCDLVGGAEALFAVEVAHLSNLHVSVSTPGGDEAAATISVWQDCEADDGEVSCHRRRLADPAVIRNLDVGTYFVAVHRARNAGPGQLVVDIAIISQIVACNDEVDNDEDGLIDAADPGCLLINDGDETDPAMPPECANGVDDDQDDRIDWPDDPECISAGWISEAPLCLETEAVVVGPAGGIFEANLANGSQAYVSQDPARCASAGAEAVYALVLDTPASVVAEVVAGNLDTVLYARAACDDAASELGCDDDGGQGARSRLQLDGLDAGVYYFFVDTPGVGRPMTIEFSVTPQ